MRKFLTISLCISALIAGAVHYGTCSPDLGYYAARDECGFAETEPDGTTHYGYTLYPYTSGSRPDLRGWCRLLSSGKTRIWNDTNGDKVKDAGELRDCEYHIWYKLEVHTQCESVLESAIRPDGVIERDAACLQQNNASIALVSVSVGDAAGANKGRCRFMRGPYSADITVQAEMQVENSKYVVEDNTRIPAGIENSGQIAAECNKASLGRTDEAVRIAREMCAKWEETYRYSVSLARDVRPFIPRQSDVPKDLSVDVSIPSKDEPSISALVYYKQANGQFYGLEMAASTMGVSTSYNSALEQAKGRFKQEAGKLKNAQSTSIPGADEAVRALYRNVGYNNETIVFRAGNVYVRVWGSIKGKSLAPTRASVIAKMVCAKITGAAPPATSTSEPDTCGVELKAEPPFAWADGKSKVKLILTARDSAGKPAANASFDIDIGSNLLGKCEDVKMITNASGKATTNYVPARAGSNAITVRGGAGSASARVDQGGILIAQDGPARTSVLADGKSGLTFRVTCVHPSGKVLGGVKVACSLEGGDVASKGKLEPATVVTDAAGSAKLTYTAPQIDPASGVRATDVYLTASASVDNPGRVVKSTERISLYAGECVYLKIEKPGFTTIDKCAFGVQSRNGTISGTVVARDGASETPVNCAKVTVAASDGKQLAEVTTDVEGKFAAAFVGDVTSPSDSRCEIPKPIELAIDPDLANRVKECREDLDELSKSSYDVDSAASFTDSFVGRLARSIPAGSPGGVAQSQSQPAGNEAAPRKKKGILGALDKLSEKLDKVQQKLDRSQANSGGASMSTECLMNAYPRLAWACRYAKLLNRRQCESSDWLAENLKAGLGDLADVFAITDKIQDAAKSKLKERYAGTEWESYRENVLADLLDIVYDQFQKAVDMAKTMNYNTDDFDGYKKFGIEWASKKTVDGITEGVKLTLQKISHKSTQEMLTKYGGAAVRGTLSGGDYKPASDRALDIFTTYEKAHNAQNISNCNTEHYRLVTKLIVDTVVKGPLLYFNMKKIVTDPEALAKIADQDTKSLEDLQDKFIKTGDLASKIGGGIDSMFQGYQGYTWLTDYLHAGSVRDEIMKAIDQ